MIYKIQKIYQDGNNSHYQDIFISLHLDSVIEHMTKLSEKKGKYKTLKKIMGFGPWKEFDWNFWLDAGHYLEEIN